MRFIITCLFHVGISVIALLVFSINAETTKPVKFPKDQRLDARFPPNIDLPSSPELPIGHLRPIGEQILKFVARSFLVSSILFCVFSFCLITKFQSSRHAGGDIVVQVVNQLMLFAMSFSKETKV